MAYQTAVGDAAAMAALVDDIEANVGPIDLFASNAGVVFGDGRSGSASTDGVLSDISDRRESS